ncbi:MAG: hypothetical protein ACOYXT_16290 [Bacteroidota bacterium]
MKIKCVTLILACFLACGFVSAQSVDEIFTNFFDKTGDIKARKNLKTLKITGTAPSPRGNFPITMYSKAPNLVKVVLDIQGQQYIAQAYDGTIAWALNPFQGGKNAEKFPPAQAEDVALDANFDAAYVYSKFTNYRQMGYSPKLEGKEQIDGRECFKIKFVKNKSTKEDAVEYYYFDTETKYLVRYTVAGITENEKWEKHQLFGDYREVGGGVKMPFLQEVRYNDKVVRKLLATNITVNENIDNSIFAYPN